MMVCVWGEKKEEMILYDMMMGRKKKRKISYICALISK